MARKDWIERLPPRISSTGRNSTGRRFGASLHTPSRDNLYAPFAGDNFTKTGDFGTDIRSERDMEVVDGIIK